ncbi:cation transporter [Dyadobacter jiangsuensis]
MDTLISSKIKPDKSSSSKTVRKTFPVLGMTCAACAVSVESTLKSVKGVNDAGVNYANQSAWAEVEEFVREVDLQSAVQSAGYDLIVDSQDPHQDQEEAQHRLYLMLKTRTIWAVLLSIPIVVIGMFFMDSLQFGNWIMMALSAPVVFYLGRGFFINAWKQAKHGKANMDTLVALSGYSGANRASVPAT